MRFFRDAISSGDRNSAANGKEKVIVTAEPIGNEQPTRSRRFVEACALLHFERAQIKMKINGAERQNLWDIQFATLDVQQHSVRYGDVIVVIR